MEAENESIDVTIKDIGHDIVFESNLIGIEVSHYYVGVEGDGKKN